jgi:O-acetyl-ADP-ribose deacetylase (regulator of RNase III)
MFYYIIGRPQTIVSLLKIGKFPEILPSFVEPKVITLHAGPKKAIASIQIRDFTQLFIVEVDITNRPTFTNPLDYETSQVPSISPNAITKVILISQTAEKLLLKLLNGDAHVNIEIVSTLFPNKLQIKNSLLDNNVKIIENGDILCSRMQTITNTVNCVGVMGKGLVLLFKNNYSNMFRDYKRKCDENKVKIGQPYLFKISDSRWILNFPTKKHWRNNSRIDFIELGLKYLVKNIESFGITSLAILPLGCGNGGLDWENEVFPLIKQYLYPLNIPMEVYIKPLVTSSSNEEVVKITKKERLFSFPDLA